MELTGILLMSSSMLFIMLIVVILVAMHLKGLAEKKDIEYHIRIDELKERIDDTQRLFRNEVSKILIEVSKIIK